ncbi:MAG: N-6 DNA methylase [Epsilonproteobacteria bacterium]|nr:N-6 DNA methylase [Campylobacterota bacterium]
MANESITDDLVRDFFKTNQIYKDNKIIIEKQQSTTNKKIDKLLKNASKSGNGKGYPDLIIQYKENPNFIIVIESKADILKHKSDELNKYKDYAVDGVLLYSSFLSKEYDVLAIAVSGQEKNKLKISHFLQLKNTKVAYPIFKDDKLLDLEEYENGYKTDERKFNQDFQELLKYSKTLNDKLHTLKVKESERSLLISGTLIALTDKAFCSSYKFKNPQSLSKYLVTTIEEKLTEVQNEHIKNIISSYSFIKNHTILSVKENELRDIIDEIDETINNFIKTYKYFDTLGQFYIEFLRYANNDKGLGIVLTPPHITELFCEIANINKDSVVLDTCTGTGGFLISAMQKMIIDASGDKQKELEIKSKQIIGVELQHDIFSLVCSNMYIHGDGRSNLIKGSCFDEEVIKEIKQYRPNVGFLNPPYKSNKDDIEELEFILNNLEQLEKGSLSIAIVPMRCALYDSGEGLILKEKLLYNNTLEAVFSMPDELFYNSKVGTNTCIMVLKAKERHPSNYKTYFGYWKDDGFYKKRTSGRADYDYRWQKIKKNWLENYQNKDEVIGHSVKRIINPQDEWCVEQYMNTDYSLLNDDKIKNLVLKYLSFCVSNGDFEVIKDFLNTNKKIKLNIDEWKSFQVGDIFDISLGKPIHKNSIKSFSLTKKNNFTPYVTRTTKNNGIELYVDNTVIPNNKFIEGNAITIGAEGFKAFYQKDKFITGNKVNILRNENLNLEVALFINSILNLEIEKKFGYGRGLVKSRLEKLNIKLPVDGKNNPNWKFMKEFIISLDYQY